MADDELNLEAENIMQPEAEAVAELTPTPVEEPVQQARITPLRSEPEAKAPPAERDWNAQPSARPADPVVDADRPLPLLERRMNISRGAPKATYAGSAPAGPQPPQTAHPGRPRSQIALAGVAGYCPVQTMVAP